MRYDDMATDKAIDWAALRAPFPPDAVDFRIQSTFERDGKTTGVVVAYVDARVVQDRLDDVCGPDGWSFDWTPVASDAKGNLTAAKGTITIAGVSKSDVGDGGQTEPTKACVSDSLKRTAVHWGVGRYLYDLHTQYADVVKRGASWVLARGEENRLRREMAAKLRQPAPPAPAQDAQPPAHSLRLADKDEPAVMPDAAETEATTAALWEQVKALATSLNLTKAEKTALNNAHPHDPQAILAEMQRMQRRAS